MSRVDQTAELVRQGLDPSTISAKFGVTLETVCGYIDRAIGVGLIRRSDVYFSVPPERRNNPSLARYAAARFAFGDLYDDVRQIEVWLHAHIRQTLQQQFGVGEAGWWRRGIPQPVRVKCHERREADGDSPCDPYSYTDLIDLARILDGQWSAFKDTLPQWYCSNKKALLDDLKQFNRIRNKVMHPVRGLAPTDADFDFVHRLKAKIGCRPGAA